MQRPRSRRVLPSPQSGGVMCCERAWCPAWRRRCPTGDRRQRHVGRGRLHIRRDIVSLRTGRLANAGLALGLGAAVLASAMTPTYAGDAGAIAAGVTGGAALAGSAAVGAYGPGPGYLLWAASAAPRVCRAAASLRGAAAGLCGACRRAPAALPSGFRADLGSLRGRLCRSSAPRLRRLLSYRAEALSRRGLCQNRAVRRSQCTWAPIAPMPVSARTNCAS